jgi:L-cystine uptake protein TcyP (sodium:dicarboxylate symporter family)
LIAGLHAARQNGDEQSMKEWGMDLAGFIVIAIVVGAVWGTTMGYLANAQSNNVSQARRWAALAGTLVVVLVSATLIQWVGDLPRSSATTKIIVSLVFFGSIGAAMSRWKFNA